MPSIRPSTSIVIALALSTMGCRTEEGSNGDLEARVAALEESLAAQEIETSSQGEALSILTTQADENTTEIDALGEEVSALSGGVDLTDIQDQVDSNTALLNDLDPEELATEIWVTSQGFVTSGDISNLENTVATNTSSIASNSGSIASTTTLVATNTLALSQNSIAIAANSTSISANSNTISTNSSSLTSTASTLATNTSAIATNTADIATNTTSSTTHAADIATNATGIATNAADIATNATSATTNAADIATNTTAIAANSTDIVNNASGVASNAADIATNTTSATTNAADIATNATNATTNATNIATNAADIATNVTALATNTTEIANNATDINDLGDSTGIFGSPALWETVNIREESAYTQGRSGLLLITSDGAFYQSLQIDSGISSNMRAYITFYVNNPTSSDISVSWDFCRSDSSSVTVDGSTVATPGDGDGHCSTDVSFTLSSGSHIVQITDNDNNNFLEGTGVRNAWITANGLEVDYNALETATTSAL